MEVSTCNFILESIKNVRVFLIFNIYPSYLPYNYIYIYLNQNLDFLLFKELLILSSICVK